MDSDVQSFWKSFSLVVIGGLLGLLFQEFLDGRRELRENTQSFVVAFNSAYFGQHRDRLHVFFVSSETQNATSGMLTRLDYVDWLSDAVSESPELSASIFAVSDFYRTVETCVQEDRCREASVIEAFSPYAIPFYANFYAILRHADCKMNFPDTEHAAAFLAGLITPPDDVCGSLHPYEP